MLSVKDYERLTFVINS